MSLWIWSHFPTYDNSLLIPSSFCSTHSITEKMSCRNHWNWRLPWYTCFFMSGCKIVNVHGCMCYFVQVKESQQVKLVFSEQLNKLQTKQHQNTELLEEIRYKTLRASAWIHLSHETDGDVNQYRHGQWKHVMWHVCCVLCFFLCYPRSFSKQRAAIEKEYGQVSSHKLFWATNSLLEPFIFYWKCS